MDTTLSTPPPGVNRPPEPAAAAASHSAQPQQAAPAESDTSPKAGQTAAAAQPRSLAKRLTHPFLYVWYLVWTSANEWINDDCPRHGASLSYYTVFSLAPLLVILVGLVGLFYGEGVAHQQLVQEVTQLAGARAGQLIDSLLQAANKPGEGGFASLIAAAILIVGATGVLVELREALDNIWQAKPAIPKNERFILTVWRLVRTRLLTFGILFAIGFLMIMSLVVSAYLAALDEWVTSHTSGMLVLAKILNPLLSFAILTFFFTILLMGLPSQRLGWRQVLPGAILSSLLFTVGKSLIGIYIGSTSTTSVYGAAGSLVALMVWVFYSSQILLMGAEFAWVLHITPKGELPGSPAYVEAHKQKQREREARLDAVEARDDAINVQHTPIAPASEDIVEGKLPSEQPTEAHKLSARRKALRQDKGDLTEEEWEALARDCKDDKPSTTLPWVGGALAGAAATLAVQHMRRDRPEPDPDSV